VAATFSLWREELKRGWNDLRGGTMTPVRLAASVAVGLAIGCLPIFGLHLFIVIALALRFRLDGAIAYLAANISNPFVAPFLFTFEVQVGAVLMDGHPLVIGEDVALLAALRSFPKYLLVGSPVVAAAFALIAFALVWAIVALKRALAGPPKQRPAYRLPDHAPPWVQAVERVAARFASPGSRTATERTSFHYVRLKLLMDPVAKMISTIAGDADGALGHVVDVGGGRGQLPILLVELGRATSAHTIDWDEDKVNQGRAAAARDGGLPITFERGDARNAEIAEADTVLLIDLLHYCHAAEQDEILRRAARAVRPGGRLVVREADTERGIRTFLTKASERLFTLIRFNVGDRVEFRAAREIAAVLEEEGLSTEIAPAWGKTPYSNVWIVARR
jgi:uncharacterized protein (DUF2062 family)/SAM-dependent methyltransferase